MSNITMKAKDSLSAKLAECYVTISGRRYNFMQAINFEANFERTKTEIPILGKTGMGNKSTGWKGTGSATFHYNTSIFREMMQRYKDTGEDVYFSLESYTIKEDAKNYGMDVMVTIKLKQYRDYAKKNH